ncbi:MAG TPA: glycosyltransferase [Chloroflexota bacterium]|nr:glycosyltransferase [Chloroflexota bacterium]
MITVLFPVNELKIGGAEQQLLELVRGLDKQRFHPIVAPLYPGGALDPEFRSVSGASVVDLSRRGKFDLRPLVSLASLVHRHDVDLVQPFLSPATFFGLTAALLAALRGRRALTVVTERCGVRRVRGLGYKAYRVTEDLLTHAADAVVANSQAGRRDLLARGIPARKTRVVYNGINLERLLPDRTAAAAHRARLGVPAGGSVVGILASLTAPKGHDTLLRALARLTQAHPDVRCAVVGDGPQRAALTALAAELGLTDRVVFFGYQRRVADFLAACDLLVSSSRDNEGCSNSILEAMALSVPVVATDVGGNPELVRDGDTGYLVPVGDDAALAHTLGSALADPAGRAVRAHRARQMVDREFGLRRMVAEYEALYQRLLEERDRATSLDRHAHAPERQKVTEPRMS